MQIELLIRQLKTLAKEAPGVQVVIGDRAMNDVAWGIRAPRLASTDSVYRNRKRPPKVVVIENDNSGVPLTTITRER